MELFPTIVTMAKTIEVISSRTKDGLSGSLQLVRLICFHRSTRLTLILDLFLYGVSTRCHLDSNFSTCMPISLAH